MDLTAYAEASAALLNTELSGVADLTAYLQGRSELRDLGTDRDCMLLRKFQRELRPAFLAGGAGDGAETIRVLNGLLGRHPIRPQICERSPAGRHLQVASEHDRVAEVLVGESLLGLATLVCDLGPERLGVCAASRCDRVFVDVSPNRSRRYCGQRCSTRANVAAHRARRRSSPDLAAPGPDAAPSVGWSGA